MNNKERVELHCQTKYSDRYSLASVDDVIRFPYLWGQSAVAVTDPGSIRSFPEAQSYLEHLLKTRGGDFKVIYGMEGYLAADDMDRSYYTKATILVKNERGLKNLYQLVTISHLKYLHRVPLIPKNILEQFREGLIIGSGTCTDELYKAVLNGENEERLYEIASYYDFLEVQPIEVSAVSLKNNGIAVVTADLLRVVEKIIAIGKECGIPVVATGDVHFMHMEDALPRSILMSDYGYEDIEQPPFCFRTTWAMLNAFSFLEEDIANEIVVYNSQKIASLCEPLNPIPQEKNYPEERMGDKLLSEICYSRAKKLYGEEIPDWISSRMENELSGIITNHHEIIYLTAMRLVKKSNKDGYTVGSRGCVAGSLVAYLAGITTINPLMPHYRCPECHYSEQSDEAVIGIELPEKNCPHCRKPMRKEGFNLPCEPLLGVNYDKEPDIDLNCAIEEQAVIHEYMKKLFGKDRAVIAGTIGTVSEYTAEEIIDSFFDKKGISGNYYNRTKLSEKLTGCFRKTGRHPGGVIVVPEGKVITDFTPVQYDGDDVNSETLTTHFEYHYLDQELLKLDILWHDDLSMLRMMQDLSGYNSNDIDISDKRILSLFGSPKELGITPEKNGGIKTGTLGIPEFGREFVLKVLDKTKPQSIHELVKLVNLMHGTGVWTENAEQLLQDGHTLSEIIADRDDVFQELLHRGMDRKRAFQIMENVRKGKRLSDDMETEMRTLDIPDWYIDSCNKIRYLFPKAHATTYVLNALKIAFYKVYYPLAFYASYLTIRAMFYPAIPDYKQYCSGPERLHQLIAEFEGNDLEEHEGNLLDDLYVIREIYARGLSFAEYDRTAADDTKFIIVDGKIMPPIDIAERDSDFYAEYDYLSGANDVS